MAIGVFVGFYILLGLAQGEGVFDQLLGGVEFCAAHGATAVGDFGLGDFVINVGGVGQLDGAAIG